MWRRKGSRVLAKLLCLWVFLGAFYFLKRGAPLSKRPVAKSWVAEADISHVHSSGDVKSSLSKDSADILRSLGSDSIYGPVPSLDDSAQFRGAYSQYHGVSRHLLFTLENCTPRAVEQFPWDGLTPELRKQGLIALHIVLAVYMFLALSLVCDRYFVPSLEVLTEKLGIEDDVSGATFMAAGSSAPELATSVIGVFVAKDDVGLGTVVGSAIYNVMFVISMCALFATSKIHLNWWPMVRDCMAYLLSVIILIVVIFDTVIVWYEAVTLLVMYAGYVFFMYFNQRLEVYCKPRCETCSCCRAAAAKENGVYDKLTASGASDKGRQKNGEASHLIEEEEGTHDAADDSEEKSKTVTHAHQEPETWHKLCEKPEGWIWTFLWLIGLPLSTIMFLTVPDCRRPKLRSYFFVTFILSLVWLSVFSFIMVWMITVIGFTINIPDSVMSLTFIAFGVSLPDVVASVLVVRDGLGDMAVSNAIGSNVFDILVCLGVPWFLETCVLDPGSEVQVYSEGLLYSSVMLLSTVVFLLVATHVNGWRLTKKYGLLLLVVYVGYTVLASLYELNIFGYFHPPECLSDY